MVALKNKDGELVLGGALVLLAGLMLVDVLPNILKSLYTQYSETLVFSYGVFAISFMAVMLVVVGFAAIRDLPAFFETVSFGWRPGEAFLGGSAKKEKKEKKNTAK
jgi:hypothetical protein